MNTVSKQLLQSSKELAKSSSEVNSLNQKLSISSSEFSSSIHTTINNLKQNNTLVVKTCNNIESGLLKTKKSQDEATEGLAVVQQFEQAMNEVANSSKKMEVIRDIVQKIELKTNVIDDIVFQTKLLSFNASIEAERAGQHGNCFAVVAIQVGKMAVASGAAAEEISLFIQESSSLAMVTLDETSFKADYGQRISVICREVFEQIIINIVEMMEKISNISNATQEQKIGLTKISLAIDSLSQISAQNVHLASQAQEVAGKIQSLADSLQTNTSSLEKILMDDKKSIDSSSVEKLKLVS